MGARLPLPRRAHERRGDAERRDRLPGGRHRRRCGSPGGPLRSPGRLRRLGRPCGRLERRDARAFTHPIAHRHVQRDDATGHGRRNLHRRLLALECDQRLLRHDDVSRGDEHLDHLDFVEVADVRNQDVLLLIDNIFRFVQAGSEVSALLGQVPSRLGYQPDLETMLASLQERIASTDQGAITSVQAVYVPADDFTDPAAVHVFGHLSASVVLSRERASRGLYPAVDPLRSDSKMLNPGVVGDRHYGIARAVREALARYEELEDVIAMLGVEELAADDQLLVGRARRLERFLTQPLAVTQQFTGRAGRLVALDDALEGCDRILSGDLDDRTEDEVYMIGGLDDLEER